MRNRLNENFSETPKLTEKSPKISETQQKIINSVTKILESSPENKRKITENFAKNFDFVTHSPEMLNALIGKIQKSMHENIKKIEEFTKNGVLTDFEWRLQSTQIINHYTQLQILALKNSIK